MRSMSNFCKLESDREMKKIFGYIAVAVMLMGAAVLSSCHGQEDVDDAINSVPEGVLRIFADKTTIVADGNDVVTFTVMLGSRNVSEERNLQLVRNGKLGNYGENTFSTVAAGDYTFSAEYYYDGVRYKTDNSVDVQATPLTASGDAQSFKQQILGFQFTSTGCVACPLLSANIKQIQSDFPNRLVAVSFHQHFSASDRDPMTHPMTAAYYQKLFSQGLPQFNANFINDNDYKVVSGYDQVVNILDRVEENYPVTCGVAIESGVVVGGSGNKVSVKVKITSNTPSAYRYQIFLVEDKIEEYQAGEGGGYLHNNVVRVVSSDNIYGADFNDGMPMQVGVEATVERTLDIPAGCNHQNMRVVVAAMSSYNGGDTYVVNNCAQCPLNGSVEYLLTE